MELKKLASIANKLDSLGLTKEADIIDNFIKKVAEPRYNLPDTNIDDLPDSPEEAQQYRAQKPAPMMGSVTYGPGGTSSIRGVTTTAPQKKEVYKASPAAPVTTPASAPTAAQQADIKSRQEIARNLGGKVQKPQDLIQEYGFNFTPTMGLTGNVAQIQKSLNSCGYSVGKVDGYWGGKTDAAFRDLMQAVAVAGSYGGAPQEIDNLVEIAGEVHQGVRPIIPFSLALVLKACEYLKQIRASGGSVSRGRSIEEYEGSKGGGRFEQKNLKDDATLRSTRAGEPVAGTPRKY
jgi:hypothetical protein